MKNRYISFLLANLFLSPDNGGGSGGGAPAPAAPTTPPAPPVSLTPEQRLSNAESGLLTAQGEITTLTAEVNRLKPLEAEAANLRTQFESATQAASKAQSELATVRGELLTANGIIATRTSERDTATGNVTRLETLCGIKGINPASAVPAQGDPASDPRAELLNKLNSATTPLERGIAANNLRAFDAKAKAAV